MMMINNNNNNNNNNHHTLHYHGNRNHNHNSEQERLFVYWHRLQNKRGCYSLKELCLLHLSSLFYNPNPSYILPSYTCDLPSELREELFNFMLHRDFLTESNVPFVMGTKTFKRSKQQQQQQPPISHSLLIRNLTIGSRKAMDPKLIKAILKNCTILPKFMDFSTSHLEDQLITKMFSKYLKNKGLENLEYLSFRLNMLSHNSILPLLKKTTQLKHLDLSFCDLKTNVFRSIFHEIPTLEVLIFSGARIGDTFPPDFFDSKFPQTKLIHLDASYTNITDDFTIPLISQSPLLQHVQLAGTQITDKTLPTLSLLNLLELDLSGCSKITKLPSLTHHSKDLSILKLISLKPMEGACWKFASMCKNLTSLSLNDKTFQKGDILCSLKEGFTIDLLHTLNLPNTKIDDEGLSLLLSQCSRSLKELRLSGCATLTKKSLHTIGLFAPNLYVLSLHACVGIDSMNFEDVKTGFRFLMEKCCLLKYLDLSQTTLSTDEAMSILSNSPCAPSIEVLFVSHGAISDLGVQFITSKCWNLRILSLESSHQITDASTTLIIDHLHFLVALDLSDCLALSLNSIYKIISVAPHKSKPGKLQIENPLPLHHVHLMYAFLTHNPGLSNLDQKLLDKLQKTDTSIELFELDGEVALNDLMSQGWLQHCTSIPFF